MSQGPGHGYWRHGYQMTSHIKLYGSKSERFESIKADLTGRLGYEPSNPEIVGYLMAGYNTGIFQGMGAMGDTTQELRVQ